MPHVINELLSHYVHTNLHTLHSHHYEKYVNTTYSKSDRGFESLCLHFHRMS